MSPTEAAQASAQLLREFELRSALRPLHGATFDGGRLWLASGRYLLHVIPDSGRVFDDFETFPEIGGLAFDGRHVWQRSRGRLEQLDVRTGLARRQVAPGFESVVGIACIESDLLVLHASGRRLARIGVRQHAFGDEAVVLGESEPFTSQAWGLAWAGGDLWSATAGALVRIDPLSARVLERLALPDGVRVLDLTADDEGRLWCVDGETRTVRVFALPLRAPGARAAPRPRSSRVVDVTTAPPPPEGFETASPGDVVGRTFERILVPLDFSATSRRSLAIALLLQQHMGSEVHLFHLAEQSANAEFLAGAGALVSLGDLAEDARARLLRFVENVFPGCSGKVVAHAAVGSDLVRNIEASAAEIGATLVLLSGSAHHHVMRSRVERTARALNCAVMQL